jgi:hypothetical protein
MLRSTPILTPYERANGAERFSRPQRRVQRAVDCRMGRAEAQ